MCWGTHITRNEKTKYTMCDVNVWCSKCWFLGSLLSHDALCWRGMHELFLPPYKDRVALFKYMKWVVTPTLSEYENKSVIHQYEMLNKVLYFVLLPHFLKQQHQVCVVCACLIPKVGTILTNTISIWTCICCLQTICGCTMQTKCQYEKL